MTDLVCVKKHSLECCAPLFYQFFLFCFLRKTQSGIFARSWRREKKGSSFGHFLLNWTSNFQLPKREGSDTCWAVFLHASQPEMWRMGGKSVHFYFFLSFQLFYFYLTWLSYHPPPKSKGVFCRSRFNALTTEAQEVCRFWSAPDGSEWILPSGEDLLKISEGHWW